MYKSLSLSLSISFSLYLALSLSTFLCHAFNPGRGGPPPILGLLSSKVKINTVSVTLIFTQFYSCRISISHRPLYSSEISNRQTTVLDSIRKRFIPPKPDKWNITRTLKHLQISLYGIEPKGGCPQAAGSITNQPTNHCFNVFVSRSSLYIKKTNSIETPQARSQSTGCLLAS
jgi:hypothetical protein